MFEKLTTEKIEEIAVTLADTCVRVVSMPDEVKRAPGPKGAASPEQAGWLNALFATLALEELERRRS